MSTDSTEGASLDLPEPANRARFVERLAALQKENRVRYDAISLLFYQTLVYFWGLTIYPMGRDYSRLTGRGEGLEFLSVMFWHNELHFFQDSVILYRLVSFVMLFVCTLAVYGIVRLVYVGGPIWLSTLAATLFMANPAMSEATLGLSGSIELFRAAVGLWAFFLYLLAERRGHVGLHVLAFGALFIAILFVLGNAGLGALPLLYLVTLRRHASKEAYQRATLYSFIAVIAVMNHRESYSLEALHPAHSLVPLYFLFYPLGFLAETMRSYAAYPILGWVEGAAVFLVLGLILRKAKANAILFGLLGAVVVRVGQGEVPIDPVHLTGGSSLVVPNAFYMLALCVLFGKVMTHPKWRRAIVTGTTLFALLMFGMQVRNIGIWRHAGNYVRNFQENVAALPEQSVGNPAVLTPDFQYYASAPLMLAKSISYDSPFSVSSMHHMIVKVNYDPDASYSFERTSGSGGRLRIAYGDVPSLIPWQMSDEDYAQTIFEGITIKGAVSTENELMIVLSLSHPRLRGWHPTVHVDLGRHPPEQRDADSGE